MSRPWWENEKYQSQLNNRIQEGNWFVSTEDGKVCGKVIKIVYNGYKIEFPGAMKVIIVNPSERNLNDLTESEYSEVVEKYNLLIQQAQEEKERIKALMAEQKRLQKICQHENTEIKNVVRAAGYDVDDTVCNNCGKILRRAEYSHIDNEDRPQISDWDWWVRDCSNKFNGYQPKKDSYIIVDEIN